MTDMRRILALWLGLGLIYAALIAWHQPLRGPLSEDEVRTAFEAQYTQIRLSEDAQVRTFLDFFLSDDGHPFFMVNLDALPEPSAETDEAARTYGAFMAPRLLVRASYPILMTDMNAGLTNSLGPGIDNAERLVVVRYRSRRDFLNIISTSEFRDAVQHKLASLDGWYSAPSTAVRLFSLPVLFLGILLLSGLLGTLWLRRMSKAQSKRGAFDSARRS